MPHTRARENTSGWGQRGSVVYGFLAEMLFTMKIYSSQWKLSETEGCQHKDWGRKSAVSSPCGTPWGAWISPRGPCQALLTQSEVVSWNMYCAAIWHNYLYTGMVNTTFMRLIPKRVMIPLSIEILPSLLDHSWVSCGKMWMGVSMFPHISFLLLMGAGPPTTVIPLHDDSRKAKWSFFLSRFSSPTSLRPKTLHIQTALSLVVLHRPADTHWSSLHTSSHQWFAGEHCWIERACVCVLLQHFPAWGEGTGGRKKGRSRGAGTLCTTKDWARAAQSKVQSDIRLLMPSNFNSAYIFHHNIIVVLIHHSPVLPRAHQPWHAMSASISTQAMKSGKMLAFHSSSWVPLERLLTCSLSKPSFL